MKERKIQISSILSRTDYNALRNYFMYQKKPTRTRFIVFTLLCSFLLLIISGTAFAMPFFKPLGLLGIVIVTLVYCWISFEVRKLEQNVKDMIHKTQELTLDDSGLTAKWTASGNAVHYEWNAFETAVETDPYFFLFLERDYALILPKIELKDRLITEIREMISTHVKLVSELSGFKADI
ncbi:MAG: hypothetical protein K0R19_894 [Bacillota bacterium]|nr:hypothetical protein [Bacillota bacterium]